MGRTQQRFGGSIQEQLIGDEKDLKSDAGGLSRDELRERLVVAEKVMKTLFKRNRDLEELVATNDENANPVASPSSASKQECLKCQGGGGVSSAGGNDDILRARIKELESQLKAAQSSKDDGEPQSFKDFMNIRLEQSQAEAKRHFENYVSMRDQLNQLREKTLLIEQS